MRILWFSITPSLFNPHSNSYNGGGWVAGLEKIVRNEPSIELGIAFEFPDSEIKTVRDGVTYYTIKTRKPSIYRRIFYKNEDERSFVNKCLRIIGDFQPDLIQIFGSENDFGLICKHTKIPIVIHMQGCLPPYHNALFPVGMNKYDFIFSRGLSFKTRLLGFRSEPSFRRRAEQEINTIQHCRYFMGRTEWDSGLVKLFNPRAVYFHCEEALRDSFLNSRKQWSPTGEKVKIISTISSPWYKGVDLVLKTASLLRRFTDLDFEWDIYGITDMSFYEYKYGINASKVNVYARGVASKDELVEAICNASLYVHPSYIDNSPNSVCEAQLLGIPVLATNVGGLSTIIKDGETGILFPANAPYTLAVHIKSLSNDPVSCQKIGSSARIHAMNRHNPENIRQTLLTIYQKVLRNEQSNS